MAAFMDTRHFLFIMDICFLCQFFEDSVWSDAAVEYVGCPSAFGAYCNELMMLSYYILPGIFECVLSCIFAFYRVQWIVMFAWNSLPAELRSLGSLIKLCIFTSKLLLQKLSTAALRNLHCNEEFGDMIN